MHSTILVCRGDRLNTQMKKQIAHAVYSVRAPPRPHPPVHTYWVPWPWPRPTLSLRGIMALPAAVPTVHTLFLNPLLSPEQNLTNKTKANVSSPFHFSCLPSIFSSVNSIHSSLFSHKFACTKILKPRREQSILPSLYPV